MIRSSGPGVVKWSKMKVLRTGLNLNDRIVLVFLIPTPRTVRKMVSVCKSYSTSKFFEFPLKKGKFGFGKILLKKEYSTEYSRNIPWNIPQNILGNIPFCSQWEGATWLARRPPRGPKTDLKWQSKFYSSPTDRTRDLWEFIATILPPDQCVLR